MTASSSTDRGPRGTILLAERLARTVSELDPNPRNAFAVTVLLEMLGYTDAHATQAGYADVFALARDVFDHIEFVRGQDASGAPSDRHRVPPAQLPSPLLAVVTQQLVWLIMVLLMVVWGRSLWSADDLPPPVAQAIAIGILGSLILSGGFQYAITQRLNFHTAQRDMLQADAFLRRAQWLGALVMAAGAVIVAAAFHAAHPGDRFAPVLAASYFLLHGVYRIAVVPLIALNDAAGILITTGAGVVLFLLAGARLAEAGTDPVRALAISQLVALTALWLGSLTRTRSLVASAPVGVLPGSSLAAIGRSLRAPRPRWLVVCLDGAPWFTAGVLYYMFLFGTRPMGWMLPPAERLTYESGVDLGLLGIIPVAVVASWSLHRYYQWLREQLPVTGLHNAPILRAEAAQRFERAARGCRWFGIAGALALLALTGGAPWANLPAQTFAVFRITVVGLMVALPGFLLSFGLLTSLRALQDAAGLLVCGLLVQVAAGIAAVRMGTAEWPALALVGSAIVLSEIAEWRARRSVRDIDRLYYSAF